MVSTRANRLNDRKKITANFGEILTRDFPHIFEKIIRFAVEGVRNASEVKEIRNRWLEHVPKYGEVSKQWKAAILRSRNLFKSSAIDVLWTPEARYKTGELMKYKKLIANGYLQVTKHLDIDLMLTTPDFDFLRSHAEGNQIEKISLSYENVFINHKIIDDAAPWSTINTIVDIFKTSKEARSFKFTVEHDCNKRACRHQQRTCIHEQEVAEQYWKLLYSAVHCNKRPKEITVDIWAQNWDEVDWNFTSQTTSSVGSIKYLNMINVGKLPNLSHLGRIETLEVMDYSFDVNHAIISQMRVKWLIVDMYDIQDAPGSFADWRDIFTKPIEASYEYPIYPAEQTITFTYHLYYREENKEFSETFKCGPSLWGNVRRWMKNVQYEWEQLDDIDDYFEPE